MHTAMQEAEAFARHIGLNETRVQERLAQAGMDDATIGALRTFGQAVGSDEIAGFVTDFVGLALQAPELVGHLPSPQQRVQFEKTMHANLLRQVQGLFDIEYVRALTMDGIIHRRIGMHRGWSLGLRPAWLRWALRHPARQQDPKIAPALSFAALFDNGWILDAYLFEDQRIQRANLAMADKVLELAPTGVLYTDPTLRITQINPAMATILGTDDTDLTGRDLTEALPIGAEAHRVLDTGQPEYALRLSLGGKALRLALTRVDSPQRSLVVMVEDLTQVVDQRAQITSSERRLHAMLEHASEGVIIIDHRGRIEIFNQAAEAIFEAPRAHVIGQPFISLLPEALRARHREHLRAFLATRDLEHLGERHHFTVTRPTGQTVHLDVRVSAHEIDGHPVLTVSLRDITEQQQAQEALRHSEQNLRNLIETIPDAVAVHRDGRFIFVNPAMAHLLGYDSPDHLLGRSPLEIVHPDDHPLVVARMQRLAANGDLAPVIEERYLRADGEVVFAEVAAIGVEYEGSPATLVIGRDITQRKGLTARMMRMDRMIAVGTLAAGVGHEINNPLTFVVANVEEAQQQVARLRAALDQPLPDATALDRARQAARDLRELLAEVSTGGERIRDIVHDLRIFAREDVRPRRPLDIHESLDFALSVANNEIKHRATLVREFAPVPPVLANESQLSQVFLNLLVNAAQAIDRGSQADNRITVRTGFVDDQVIIEFIDTGEGITDHDLPHLFDPFFTTKPVGQGTGLGLSICQRIINDHGGEIQIESTHGQGSCFRVLLPATTQMDEQPASSTSDQAPIQRRGRVLFIDDEPSITRLAARALERTHDVAAAGSAAEAADLIDDGPAFDVIFCDLMMPGQSGVDLYEAVRTSAPDQATRFVFITGGAFTPETWTFLEQTPQPHLDKPFGPRDLRQAVARMMQQDR